MPSRSWLLALVACLLPATPSGAQLLAQDHPGQYAQEDIARGAVLYSTQCNQCHGRDGDQISGIDLRRGQFRRAQSDEDLAQVITRGTTSGMPPFALQPSELTGIVAFIRAGFDTTASIRVGNATRGRTIFAGKGQCATCHRVAGQGPRLAPDLSDIGMARAPAALDRSIRDPSSGDDADQSAGADRDEERQHDSRTTAERGHLQRADHRRPGAAAVAREDGHQDDERRDEVADAGLRRYDSPTRRSPMSSRIC